MTTLRPSRANRRWMMLAGCAVAAILGTSSCEPSSGSGRERVVLYYSADDAYARPIIELFEARTGIEVIARTDTEATKTTGLVQRLRAEKGRPRADVFWSSEVFLTIQLAQEGLLEPHVPSVDHGRPEQLSDHDHLWHGFGLRARVLVYNTRLVTPEMVNFRGVPLNMQSLAYQHSGLASAPLSVAMANPIFGTTRGHMAALVSAWGPERTRRWLNSLADEGVQILDGNSSVVRAVGEGRAVFGLTDTDDVWAGRRNGLPIDMVYIRHDHTDAGVFHGPLLIPNTVARVREGPNAESAAKLIDFLLEPIVERMLAESDSHNIPTHPDLQKEFRALIPPNPMTIPYDEIAAHMDTALKLCQEELAP